MAFKLIDKSYCAYLQDHRCKFVVDAESDIAKLPKCCTGSTAIVADETHKCFMVNASGEWKDCGSVQNAEGVGF